MAVFRAIITEEFTHYFGLDPGRRLFNKIFNSKIRRKYVQFGKMLYNINGRV